MPGNRLRASSRAPTGAARLEADMLMRSCGGAKQKALSMIGLDMMSSTINRACCAQRARIIPLCMCIRTCPALRGSLHRTAYRCALRRRAGIHDTFHDVLDIDVHLAYGPPLLISCLDNDRPVEIIRLLYLKKFVKFRKQTLHLAFGLACVVAQPSAPFMRCSMSQRVVGIHG